jgi:hypothetical protein
MTTLTDTQVVTASGGLVELGYLEKTSTVAVNVGSGAQVSVIGPLTIVTDGSPLMVEFFCEEAAAPATAGAYLIAALWVDGAENTRTMGVAYAGATGSNHGETLHAVRRVTLSAGSHTIEIKGWSSAAANFYAAAGGTAAYAPAFLRVSKIVQATQWPAVTTGVIICTSTTRPASPFEGQTIYETDTDLSLTWSGSAWVQTGSIGAWTTFSPTLTQSVTVTKTDSYCKWTRYGRTIHATTFVSATASGTTANPVTLSLPVTAAAPLGTRIGSCHIYDASTGVRYTGMAELRSGGSSVGFVGDWSAGDAWGSIPNLPVGSTDQIGYSVTYEAAS